MLEEIVEATGIVVVEDARLDPRTDKAIVERLGNRTIVNIPVILFNKHLGAIGTGTFGDEGVHVPTPREQEFLAALASHMAVALDRIQLLAERVQTEAALRQRANELEALVSTSLALRNIDEVTPLISVVVRQALKVVNGDYGAVFLLEPETGDLVSAGWCEGDAPLLSAETALRHRPGEGITGHVARTGQIYITADVSRDPMAHILPEEADQLRETRSGISLPLRVQEAVIGVLHVWVRETGRVFSEADIRLLTAITEMASAAIHRAALYEQTERHAAELLAALAREQHLNEVARIISSTLDNETILHNVLRLAVELTVAEAGTIGLVMLDETPRLACRHYLFPAAPQVDEVAQGDGVGWRIIQTGRAERLADYSTDPQALPSLVAAGVRAFLGVPLSASQERLGVLGLFMFSTERQFTQRDQALAEAVGQEAGVALQNSRLYHDLQTRNADLERAVRRARVLAIEAAEANRLKSEFLANTSHELRTPVTAIIGSLDLVLNDVLDTPQEQQDFLQIAFRAAQGLREIVEQILDMMRLEAQKMDVRLQACDVTLLVEEVRWKAQPAVLTKGLTLNVQIPSHAPRLWADPEKVRQVLLILVENAIKFTECGSVTIRVDPPTIEHLSIVVSDTGLGIPPERQAKLFQPFVQADGSHTRTHGGLGLGLSISRRLAELMNGTLTLHSAGIGQGTTVTLTLPLAA